jgi:hypothetical protein
VVFGVFRRDKFASNEHARGTQVENASFSLKIEHRASGRTPGPDARFFLGREFCGHGVGGGRAAAGEAGGGMRGTGRTLPETGDAPEARAACGGALLDGEAGADEVGM